MFEQGPSVTLRVLNAQVGLIWVYRDDDRRGVKLLDQPREVTQRDTEEVADVQRAHGRLVGHLLTSDARHELERVLRDRSDSHRVLVKPAVKEETDRLLVPLALARGAANQLRFIHLPHLALGTLCEPPFEHPGGRDPGEPPRSLAPRAS
jgi:hypothetical protein